MKIVPLSDNRLEEAVAFSCVMCSQLPFQSCPIFDDPNAVLLEYRQRLDDKTGSCALAEDDDGKIAGAFCYVFDPDQRCLQTTLFHVAPGKEEAGRLFLDYIAQRCPQWRIVIILPTENTTAGGILKEKGLEVFHSAVDLQAELAAVPEEALSSDVMLITEENFDLYAPYHDAQYPGSFLTSDRLRGALGKLSVLAVKENDAITGSVFFYSEGDLAQIAGMSAATSEKAASLLRSALLHLKATAPEVRLVCLSSDPGNALAIAGAKTAGFTVRSAYNGWTGVLGQ